MDMQNQSENTGLDIEVAVLIPGFDKDGKTICSRENARTMSLKLKDKNYIIIPLQGKGTRKKPDHGNDEMLH